MLRSSLEHLRRITPGDTGVVIDEASRMGDIRLGMERCGDVMEYVAGFFVKGNVDKTLAHGGKRSQDHETGAEGCNARNRLHTAEARLVAT